VALRVVIVVALLWSGAVPQGFMRAGGSERMRLVLCTGEGPQEAWIAPDGRIQSDVPGDDAPERTSRCLAIALLLVQHQLAARPVPRLVAFHHLHLIPADQAHEVALPVRPGNPRAPPLLA
jgi:hypothetical protein